MNWEIQSLISKNPLDDLMLVYEIFINNNNHTVIYTVYSDNIALHRKQIATNNPSSLEKIKELIQRDFENMIIRSKVDGTTIWYS